jgi:hypothetical protein
MHQVLEIEREITQLRRRYAAFYAGAGRTE